MLAFTTQTNLCSFFFVQIGPFQNCFIELIFASFGNEPVFFLWSVEISSKVNEIKTFITLLKLILNLTFFREIFKGFCKDCATTSFQV